MMVIVGHKMWRTCPRPYRVTVDWEEKGDLCTGLIIGESAEQEICTACDHYLFYNNTNETDVGKVTVRRRRCPKTRGKSSDVKGLGVCAALAISFE